MAESVGEIIKNARKACGMTQAALAKKISVTPQAVSTWEQGINLPDVTLLGRLAEILSVEPNLLYASLPKEKEANRGKGLKKTLTATRVVAVVLLALSVALAAAFAVGLIRDRADDARYHASMALKIASRESNYFIDFLRDGKKGAYCRKYFFDGRLLYYYAFDGAEYYGYEGRTYRKTGETEGEEVEGFSLFPIGDLDGLVVPTKDMKSPKKKDGAICFAFVPKNNDIYAYLLGGEAAKYAVRLTETDGVLLTMSLSGGSSECYAEFRFAYDFTLAFPAFIPR
ncbi:MAG: helix-turn-helix transcriptional regulator [Candidatus Borkfalkiaceae bacterium]|nr:helix-turn-helix transcriptional regulator [Christensenellaceae bacterium]